MSSPALLANLTTHGILAAESSGLQGVMENPMIFMVLMFVMMYVVLIRPQRRRQKQLESLIKALKVGDEVVTIGGAHGVVTSLKEKTLMLRIADGVKVEFDRSAVASVVEDEKPAAS